MKASETNLQAIIEGTKQYIIPMFQRTYSWTEKQWNQLWDDIIDLIEDDNNLSHFIGSVVSIPVNANTHGVQQFLVIDGQQRLTTLLLLLAAIRDNAKQQNKGNLSDEIQHTLLVNNYKSGEEFYKFLPTQVDKEYFKKIINMETMDGINDSLVINAYRYFRNEIEESTVEIDRLKMEVTTNLSIVSIVLSPDDNPYLVFESLNAKGQPLTQSDLIRNYLFMRIPGNEQEDMYKRYWLPMQERLGGNLTEFIRHYLLGLNINVKKNEVYVRLKEKVDKQDAMEFMKTLSLFADYYLKLLEPDYEEDKSIQALLKRINAFEAKTSYPFLLYIYRDYKDKKYTSEQLKEIVSAIENFLVRRFVCNIDSKSLNKIFAALYNQVSTSSAEDSIEELKAYLQVRGYPKDSEVILALKDNPLYGQGDRRVKGLFILKAIEGSYKHKEKVDLSTVTIEHIMPQTLTDFWLDELGSKAETLHNIYLHTLGNLTLTGYNSALSNEKFAVKKKYYGTSNIQMNKDLCVFNSWNEESIIKRSNGLIGRFLKIWTYFGKDSNEKNKITGSSPRLLNIHQKNYSVKTWRDVMEKTILAIFDDNQEVYKKIMANNSGFLSVDGKGMRSPKKIVNGDYMEANLSAQAIYNFCLKIFEEAGNNKDKWHVETEIK